MTTNSAAAGARCAVIAGHGDFASGAISAVEQISGRGGAFRALTNRDLGAEALESALRAAVTESAARVVFTDLPAGSCTIAARRVARTLPGLTVVTGANLSTLLAWALGTDDGRDACERAAARGRDSLMVLAGDASVESRRAD